MGETQLFYYQKRLREELMARVDRNPRYSIRSFAQALGLQSSALSQIMAGKRAVSTKVLDRLLSRLEMNPGEQKAFVQSVIDEKKSQGLQRVSPDLLKRLREFGEADSTTAVRPVGLDEFRIIADWYHYAILELTFSKHFKPDSRWIAKELNISVTEAKLAVERMIELELLERKNGTLKKTDWNLDSKDKTKTSAFHRRRQKQILEKSIASLEQDPIEERNHSSITVCIDPKNIPAAKTKIQKFMWELAGSLVEGTPDRVYEMTVNLFPVQKKAPTKGSEV